MVWKGALEHRQSEDGICIREGVVVVRDGSHTGGWVKYVSTLRIMGFKLVIVREGSYNDRKGKN